MLTTVPSVPVVSTLNVWVSPMSTSVYDAASVTGLPVSSNAEPVMAATAACLVVDRRAYEAAALITFEGRVMRNDIALSVA